VKLVALQSAWESLARFNPTWAILSTDSDLTATHELEQFFASGASEIAHVFAKLDEFGVAMPQLAAVDFGCGIGRLTQAIAGRFPRTIGIDVSPSMVQLARKYDEDHRCEFVANDTDDLAFLATGCAGFVFSTLVLQHIPSEHSRRYISEFLRILAPGGAAAFQIPSKAPTAINRRLTTIFVPVLYPLIPRSLFKLYRRVRYRNISKARRDAMPIFDRVALRIYGIDRTEIEELVRQRNAEILLVESTDEVGAGWPSFRYFIQKSQGAP